MKGEKNYSTNIFDEITTYCEKNKEDRLLNLINSTIKNINDSCFDSSEYIKNIKKLTISIIEDLTKKREIYVGENDILDVIKESDILENSIENILTYILKDLDIKENIDINKFNNINEKLKDFINWYINNFIKKVYAKKDSLSPILFEEITYEDILETYKIEKLSYKEESVSLPETTYMWYKHNKLTLLGVRDENTKKLIGFINILPIKKSFFDKLLSGKFDDTNISVEEIEKYDKKGFYDLYIASVCIHPKYNKIKVFSILYTMFIDFVIDLYKKDIYFKSISADCVTDKGLNLSKSIGMEKIINTDHDTSLYKLDINKDTLKKIKLVGKKGKEIISLYENIIK